MSQKMATIVGHRGQLWTSTLSPHLDFPEKWRLATKECLKLGQMAPKVALEIPATWYRTPKWEFKKTAGRGAGTGAGKNGGAGRSAGTGAGGRLGPGKTETKQPASTCASTPASTPIFASTPASTFLEFSFRGSCTRSPGSQPKTLFS